MTVRQMFDNFLALEGAVDSGALASLKAWTENEVDTYTRVLQQRFDGGFVRDCHGDLHLANLVRMPAGIRTFDCIEFNADLRRIDVVCDYAFLVMDLDASGRADLAAYFLNRYLERTGDYAGVEIVDLFYVYRCLVRAKVAVICAREADSPDSRLTHIAEAERYCGIAMNQTSKPAPMLVVMRGLSGSGKSWVSAQLMAALPAIRLKSDIERKRLFGLPETADSQSALNSGLYTPDSSRAVYRRLLTMAKSMLNAGHSVILDAAFLQVEERRRVFAMADREGCAALIVDVQAPLAVIRNRLLQRQRDTAEASEAGPEVLNYQLSATDPLKPTEIERTVAYENVAQSDIEALAGEIRELARANSTL